MKKLSLFAVLCTFTLSCSDDDSTSTNNNTNTDFHPPTWVQGTWLYSMPGADTGLKFTSDNVCSLTNSTSMCYKEMLAIYEGTQAQIGVDEEISDTHYHVDISIAGSINSYDVEKISATQIKWMVNSTQSLTLTKQ